MTALLLALALGPADRRPLGYAPAPPDNPLKGLVPYAGQGGDRFPHSLEFGYLPYSALVKGYDAFDWAPMEALLDSIAARGHQAVFRIYLEYPGQTSGIPDFLRRDGLKVTNWLFPENDPPARIDTPDYQDPKLRRSLAAFIAALGQKYDGDPRIGFITAGLLGAWGEWHTYPRDDLFASKAVQREVMDAYEAAFTRTPVLLRYPAGPADPQKADNAGRRFGYHDDSFAWATLPTGKKGDEWFYMTALTAAGPAAVAKWKTQPIGGEIRPEAWGQVFDDRPKNSQVQDFLQCVEATHATWLMDSGMFGERKPPAGRRERAVERVRRLGYEFHVPAVTAGPAAGGKLPVRVELENRGVAPFYADWRPEYGLLSAAGELVRTAAGSGKLTGLLPGDPARVWADTLDAAGLPAGSYTLLLRVPNPLPNGRPVRFANREQDADRSGWLTLGRVSVPANPPPRPANSR